MRTGISRLLKGCARKTLKAGVGAERDHVRLAADDSPLGARHGGGHAPGEDRWADAELELGAHSSVALPQQVRSS